MLIGFGNLELTYYMNQKIKANSTESKSATYTTFKWASIQPQCWQSASIEKEQWDFDVTPVAHL